MRPPETDLFESFDGTRMAVHSMGPEDGGGRPVLLLHGLFSNADVNWIKFGTAQMLVDAGFRAIMPDWRVHGASEAPRDPARYTPGVLTRDALHLVEALGLADYDLVGFSLGARTAVSAVLAGLAPRRLVLSGMGLEGLSNWQKRVAFFVDAIDRFEGIEPGDPAFVAKSFMKTTGVDRIAARLLLTQGVDGIDLARLGEITMPAMVLIGEADRDNGSPQRLAEALGNAHVEVIPGNHMSCVTRPEFGQAIATFLAAA